ncbi:hypothetical protein C478_07292 [Natrinema thermotolerans DSM 11552]|nr:hypothetical protein C478_07292 [Natrinema thermotolerans DSM 11552]
MWGLVGDRERILPTPVQQTWQQIKGALPEALGFKGDAQDQIVASVLLAVLAYASSVVTAGLTIALGVLFTITALIGVLRMIPAVGDRFTDARRNGGDRSWDVRRR